MQYFVALVCLVKPVKLSWCKQKWQNQLFCAFFSVFVSFFPCFSLNQYSCLLSTSSFDSSESLSTWGMRKKILYAVYVNRFSTQSKGCILFLTIPYYLGSVLNGMLNIYVIASHIMSNICISFFSDFFASAYFTAMFFRCCT